MCGVVWCSMKRMDGIPLRAEQKENFLQGCGDRILVLQAIPHAAHDTSKVVPPPPFQHVQVPPTLFPFFIMGFCVARVEPTATLFHGPHTLYLVVCPYLCRPNSISRHVTANPQVPESGACSQSSYSTYYLL